MARQTTGQLYEWTTKKGVTAWGVRFRHAGKRRFEKLGSSSDGMTRRQAEHALADLMADVRRGLWTAPELRAPEPQSREVPTFHEFATDWYEAAVREGGRDGRGLGERAAADLHDWRLRDHILPFFHAYRLDEITVEVVDRYRRAKVREGRLSPGSINKMLTTLAAILEVAVEYGHLDRNPARGRRRRLRAATPRRVYLDRAEQIAALIEAAGALDCEGRVRPYRRALLSTLVFSGLRIGEALDLRWTDVRLGGGQLRVRGTKTSAAQRTVKLLPALRDELAVLKAARDPEPEERVFITARGGRLSESNVRNRVLAPAVEAANASLVGRGAEAIPEGLSPHGLRRTFASVLVALGRDPAVVMRQMGHTTAGLTLGVYAAAMDWEDGERDRLQALVEGAPFPSSGREMGNGAGEARPVGESAEAA